MLMKIYTIFCFLNVIHLSSGTFNFAPYKSNGPNGLTIPILKENDLPNLDVDDEISGINVAFRFLKDTTAKIPLNDMNHMNQNYPRDFDFPVEDPLLFHNPSEFNFPTNDGIDGSDNSDFSSSGEHSSSDFSLSGFSEFSEFSEFSGSTPIASTSMSFSSSTGISFQSAQSAQSNVFSTSVLDKSSTAIDISGSSSISSSIIDDNDTSNAQSSTGINPISSSSTDSQSSTSINIIPSSSTDSWLSTGINIIPSSSADSHSSTGMNLIYSSSADSRSSTGINIISSSSADSQSSTGVKLTTAEIIDYSSSSSSAVSQSQSHSLCNSTVCFHNSTCVDIITQMNESDYYCSCSVKYYGRNCELETEFIRVVQILNIFVGEAEIPSFEESYGQDLASALSLERANIDFIYVGIPLPINHTRTFSDSPVIENNDRKRFYLFNQQTEVDFDIISNNVTERFTLLQREIADKNSSFNRNSRYAASIVSSGQICSNGEILLSSNMSCTKYTKYSNSSTVESEISSPFQPSPTNTLTIALAISLPTLFICVMTIGTVLYAKHKRKYNKVANSFGHLV